MQNGFVQKPGGRRDTLKTCRICHLTKRSTAFLKDPGDECSKCVRARKRRELAPSNSAPTQGGVSTVSDKPWHLQLMGELESLGKRIVSSITDEQIAKTGLRDKMVAMGILVEKHQLLKGQPTQILSIDRRQKMLELAKALQGELERRGLLTVDVTPKKESIDV